VFLGLTGRSLRETAVDPAQPAAQGEPGPRVEPAATTDTSDKKEVLA
jgi:hypothetical protein